MIRVVFDMLIYVVDMVIMRIRPISLSPSLSLSLDRNLLLYHFIMLFPSPFYSRSSSLAPVRTLLTLVNISGAKRERGQANGRLASATRAHPHSSTPSPSSHLSPFFAPLFRHYCISGVSSSSSSSLCASFWL